MIENLTMTGDASLNILGNTSELTNQVFSSLKDNIIQTIKPFLAIIGGIVGLYIIYLIVRAILSFIQERRNKKIHKNTEEILRRLNLLEQKIDNISKKKKK